MRRLLVVLIIAFLGLPLVAATPTSPLYTKPNVIVYPFTSNGSTIDREASSRLATIIATQMADSGQVSVTPPPPGTERKDFLSVARANRCDYYISGFISALGNGVSVVEQVVSTATGIVVFSQTAQLNTYNDAAGQGDDLARFVAAHANRGLAAIGTAPPRASPTPAPSPEANLGKLFGRRKKNTPTANPPAKPSVAPTARAAALINVTPTPRAVIAGPPALATTPTPPVHTAAPQTVAVAGGSESVAVLPIEGGADAALRELATQRIVERTHGERATSSTAACTAGPVHAVLSGILAVRPDSQFGGASATFELDARDCSGKVLWHQSASNDAGGTQGSQLATERAVDAAVGAYLNPPKRRRR